MIGRTGPTSAGGCCKFCHGPKFFFQKIVPGIAARNLITTSAERNGNAVAEQAGNKVTAIAKKRRISALFRAFPDCRFDARPIPGGLPGD